MKAVLFYHCWPDVLLFPLRRSATAESRLPVADFLNEGSAFLSLLARCFPPPPPDPSYLVKVSSSLGIAPRACTILNKLTESMSLTRSGGQLLIELPYGGMSPLAN